MGKAKTQFRKRVDRNQRDIVKSFRQLGAFVHHTHEAGRGFPDLVVGLNNAWHLVEVKDGEKNYSGKGLTDAQVKFFDACNGYGEQPYIVETIADTASLVERWKKAREFCQCGCPREYHFRYQHECTHCGCEQFQNKEDGV